MNFDECIVGVYFRLIETARKYYYHDERAHDLAADTVLRALEARDRYDESRPLMAWCRAIMRNLWRNNEQRLSAVLTSRLGEWEEPGGEDADQRARVNDILTAVRSQRAQSVAVETLVDFAKGYSIAEIASARGVPQGTVKRRIHDARKMLAKLVHVNRTTN